MKFKYAGIMFGEGVVQEAVWDGEVSSEPDNPAEWIRASVNDDDTVPDMKTKVTVPNGTVAQSSPYTRDGKAWQTRWDFTTDNSGNTTVRETNTPRPDLTPGSSAAPNLPAKPSGSGGQLSNGNTNTDGSAGSSTSGGSTGSDSTNLPDSNGNASPDSGSTGSNTDPNTGTNPNPDTDAGDGGASTPKPPEVGLCDMYPGILACDQMGDAPAPSFFDDIKIPHVTDDRTWQEDLFLPSDGVCPAPKTFSVWGQSFQVSYEPLCELMRKIRFMVLIAFILMSAKIVFGGLRSK